MFSVVNGVMLRGFSFPTADRLASANFIDLSSANPGGFNGQISSMDYDELLPQQQSFEMMAAYLNGSTVNVTDNGKPQRYTGAYVTDRFLTILGTPPMLGRDFTPADNMAGRREGRHHRLRHLAARLRRLAADRRQGRAHQRQAGDDHRRDAEGLRVPAERGAVAAALQRVPAEGAQRSRQHQPVGHRPAQARRLPRSGHRGVHDAGQTFRRRLSGHQQAVQHRPGRAADQDLHAAPAPRHAADDARLLRRRAADRLRQRDEHAVRARDAARQGAGDPLVARRDPRPADPPDAHREPAGRRHRRRRSGSRSPTARPRWLQATVRSLDNPPPAYITFDVDALVLAVTVAATIAAAVLSGLLPAWMSSRANANAVLRDGGRGTTSRSITVISRGLVVFQIVVTCVLLIGSLLQVRSILNQQTIDYGYDTDGMLSARMGLMDGDYPTADARKLFYDRLLRAAAREPGIRRGRLHQPLPHGLLRQRSDRDRRQDLQGQEGSAAHQLRAGHRHVLRRHEPEAARRAHTSTTTTSTRSCRSPSSTPRSRASTSATRARSAGASGP